MKDYNNKELNIDDIVSLTIKDNTRRAGTITETFSKDNLIQVEVGTNNYIIPSADSKLIARASEL